MGDSGDVVRSYGASTAPYDPESGQRGAFPGLDSNEDGDELFYGPASDGLQYLRMVRYEAHSVPKLLRAKNNESVQEEASQEAALGGRYEDGAFIAEDSAASDEDMEDADSLDDDDAQGIYYRNLLERFTHFRELLAKPPPDARPPSQQTLPKALQPQVRQGQWSYDLRRTTPTTNAIHQASQEDIIRGLGRIESLLIKANLTSEPERGNLGSWTWALLGRCRDMGTLGSDDVSVLRSLAKAALALSNRLLRSQHDQSALERGVELGEDDEAANGSEQVEASEMHMETDSSGKQGVETSENLETARTAMLTRLGIARTDDSASIGDEAALKPEVQGGGSKDALVTLDIIVTIVGGAFGQKDLLDMRAAWQ